VYPVVYFVNLFLVPLFGFRLFLPPGLLFGMGLVFGPLAALLARLLFGPVFELLDRLLDRTQVRLATTLVHLRAMQSPSEVEGLWPRALRAASKWPKVWRRFGRLLPSRAREKFFDPDLAEHTSDFFEALSTAGSHGKQNQLILSFTIAAVAKVLACMGAAFRCRLRNEFDSLSHWTGS